MEQIAHQDKKRREREEKPPEAKVKKMEETKGEGNGQRSEQDRTCRFFLTEGGCKKGKQCSWSHVLDDQRRCWTCGSTRHLAPDCDRPRGASQEKGGQKGGRKAGFTTNAKTVKREEMKREEPTKKEDDKDEPYAQGDVPSSS